jgi:PAT family beta-lactamase induction signal transducer AmpG
MTDRQAGWLAASRVYTDRRVIAILFLGFSSGLPLLLTFSTLSIWLKESGISKTEIGLFALVGLPYSIKFLWAPLIDRLPLPLLTRLLGRRRGWTVFTQLGLVAGIVGLGASDPLADPWTTALWALIVSFASASQDVVIDAYRVEILDKNQYGAGAAMIVAGYRLGMLASGAGALFLAESTSWFWVYVAMAALMAVGMIAILLSPEPTQPVQPERNEPGQGETLGRVAGWLADAVVAPLADFLRRPGWLAILLFVLLYKFGDSLAGVMANPFYVEVGFSKGEIASVSKIFGLGATLFGGFAGGLLVARIGIMQSLLLCGLLQLVSNLMFAVQAAVGHSIPMLAVTIAVENISGGMGTAAFVAYLSSLCNVAYTATQYALLSSFMAFARTLLSSPGGWLADRVDWIAFFVLTTVAAVPGLLLWYWLKQRGFVPEAAPPAHQGSPP